ncbi:hypothetical protein JCM9957A_52330 [Kineosporia succinea]
MPPAPRPARGPARARLAIPVILALVVGFLTLAPALPAQAAETLLSQGRPATASSSENGAATEAALAVDGNTATRWSSAFADPQWLQVDLGSTQAISRIELNWEAAYASAFTVQTSANGTSWTNITPTTAGQAGVQSIAVTGSGRYVRMNGTSRATPYGYSLYEFKVFGGSDTSIPTSDTPDFGPNVKIFDSSTSAATIQSAVDAAFNSQLVSPTAQFGTQRYAFLFKPGTYGRVWANLGFYTSVAGLGLNPDDVTINGALNVDSGWNYGDTSNATQNFWRSAENLSVVPEGGTDRWAVSQAAPMRRVHIKGNLTLGPSNQDNGQGYSSGGYLADSKVDGSITSGSQQQWYTRDSSIGSWSGGVWNMVYSGVQGAPANAFPSPPHTTLASTPVTREKPYLYVDGAGKYRVFVPSLKRNSSGTSWPNSAGSSIPMSQFYVARPGDSAARINQALAQGLNLFFTPGTYSLSETIKVTRADTVVTGIGFPTADPVGWCHGPERRGRQRGEDQRPDLRRGHHQQPDPDDGRHRRHAHRPRGQPDQHPGRVLPGRQQRAGQGHDQPRGAQ